MITPMEICLSGPRVTLRKLTLADAPVLFAYRSLPEVYRYQGWYPETISDAEDFIRKHAIETKGSIGEWVQLGICAKTDGALLGDCGYHVISDSEAEIGYTLAPRYQRKGYATEVVETLLTYLFENAQFKMVTASTDPENDASIRVLEKNGFKKSRLLEKSVKIRGEWRDDLVFEHTKH